MSVSNYKVHKLWVKEADFEVLVLEIPEAEIEDKLAYFARDKGNINRSFYEDFVIATCVANINQLLFHIKQQALLQPNLMSIRLEIMNGILEINPLFQPDNLVINRNSVVKLKGKKGPKDGERLLVDNKSWNLSYYEEVMKNQPQIDVDSINPTQAVPPTEDVAPKKPAATKPLNELEYVIVKKWWKRINRYVEIKQFKEEDMGSILKQRFFHNRSSFQTFIVSVCVIDSDELLTMLDNMGIPSRVAPPILMHEIYELCREDNKFLTYENAQKFTEGLENDENDTPQSDVNRNTPNRMASHARQQGAKKKKPKKIFKDVPKEDLLKLSDNMKVFLIGQDQAINDIAEAVQRASVGLKDPVRPIGSFLFAGRTGIGKTLAAKVLADELIRDRDNLITIDCSEYSADHEYAKLIGSPQGYIGFEQGGYLTNAVMKSPFSVVVFDEVEKASTKVHELLLQILEEGRLTDGKGQHVSFKDTIVIMTSNVGVGEVDAISKTIGFGDVAKITDAKKDKAIDEAIKGKFKPEFINRIDSIIKFNGLSKDDYMRIIDIELYKLNDNLKNNDTEYKGLTLKFDNKIKKLIYDLGINEAFGARPLKRCIEKEVATPIAMRLLKESTDPDSLITISARNKKVSFKINKKPEELFVSDTHKEMATLNTALPK